MAALPKHLRFTKSQGDYRRKQDEIMEAWPQVSARLKEAKRFEADFLAAISD